MDIGVEVVNMMRSSGTLVSHLTKTMMNRAKGALFGNCFIFGEDPGERSEFMADNNRVVSFPSLHLSQCACGP